MNPSIARWAPIPLRLIVGCGFMARGFAKLSKGSAAFATIQRFEGRSDAGCHVYRRPPQ